MTICLIIIGTTGLSMSQDNEKDFINSDTAQTEVIAVTDSMPAEAEDKSGSNVITKVLLPVALMIIMLGMGLSLRTADFKRVGSYPKAAAIGLTNQMIVLPLVAFGIAQLSGLSGPLTIGLMILSACPGGVTSNLISHLSKGDTALSVSLTAMSSVLSILTIPLIVNYSIGYFSTPEETIAPPTGEIVKQIVAVTVVPICLGMLIRGWKKDFALRMEKPVKIFSAIVLALVIVGAVLKQKEILIEHFGSIWSIALGLNVATMMIGFMSAKLLRLSLPQTITVSVESGIQNGTLAILIATTILKQEDMMIVPAIYSLLMFGTGGFMIAYFGRRTVIND